MNKLKVYKFIEKNIYMTPSLDIGCRVGASQVNGIKASWIRFGPANRVGSKKGRYTAPNSLPLQGGKGFSRSSSKLSSLEGVWLPRKREKMRENEAREKEAGELKASP